MNIKQSAVTELQRIIERMGWYTGESQLSITYKGSFEGYYGKASENWEQQAVIELKEIKEDGKIICPAIKVTGLQYDKIEDVAQKVLNIYRIWESENI